MSIILLLCQDHNLSITRLTPRKQATICLQGRQVKRGAFVRSPPIRTLAACKSPRGNELFSVGAGRGRSTRKVSSTLAPGWISRYLDLPCARAKCSLKSLPLLHPQQGSRICVRLSTSLSFESRYSDCSTRLLVKCHSRSRYTAGKRRIVVCEKQC